MGRPKVDRGWAVWYLLEMTTLMMRLPEVRRLTLAEKEQLIHELEAEVWQDAVGPEVNLELERAMSWLRTHLGQVVSAREVIAELRQRSWLTKSP